LTDPFVYTALPARVIFGAGKLAVLADEIRQLGARRAVLLSTPGQGGAVRAIADTLGDLAAGVLPIAVMHTPVDITERALAAVCELRADCTVAIGGGSTIGLGKAIALRTGLPQIAVPTTYAGSEMTPIIGETKAGVKTTERTLAVLPETVIYDTDLTLSLPPALSATSGMNAIAHAVEALYARDRNPVIALMAVEAIGALARALPAIVAAPGDRAARADAQYGAWLCGICLGSAGMALHHKLCHTLGGSFGLPHAETHTIILPHAVAYNAVAAPETMSRIAKALGVTEAARGLYDLAGKLGAKRALAEIGMPKDGIEKAAQLAVSQPYWNPRPIDHDGIRGLIARAWAGEPPLMD
jgi:maleylacetate reductase